MALGGSAIASVRSALGQVTSNKTSIEGSIETIEYVKNNNDLTMWADDTVIGSKWNENVNKLIQTSKEQVAATIDDLVQKTEQFLQDQEQTNNSGQ